MKKVRVVLEAIVPDYLIRDEEYILDEYESFEDVASMDGLDAFIDGSYEYTASCEIVDVIAAEYQPKGEE